MRPMPFRHKMNGAFNDLGHARHHGQSQEQGIDRGATMSHTVEYTRSRQVTGADLWLWL